MELVREQERAPDRAQQETVKLEWRSKGKKGLTKFVRLHVDFMLKQLYKEIYRVEIKLQERPSQNKDKAMGWFQAFYSSASAPELRVVGPVGERPLHVCALSVNRFGNIDFEGEGNYLKDGIIKGMKDFLKSESGQDTGSGKDNSEEMFAVYGKDYCAAVGDYLENQSNSTEPIVWDRNAEEGSDPPCWEDLQNWRKRRVVAPNAKT
jgi:hypothetical protein